MHYILYIIALLALAFAVLSFSTSQQNVVHEIEALIAGLIATCAFGLGGVIHTLLDRIPLPPSKPKG
jgi:hypothetical protein